MSMLIKLQKPLAKNHNLAIGSCIGGKALINVILNNWPLKQGEKWDDQKDLRTSHESRNQK